MSSTLNIKIFASNALYLCPWLQTEIKLKTVICLPNSWNRMFNGDGKSSFLFNNRFIFYNERYGNYIQ